MFALLVLKVSVNGCGPLDTAPPHSSLLLHLVNAVVVNDDMMMDLDCPRRHPKPRSRTMISDCG